MKTFADYLKDTGEIGFIEKLEGSIVQASGLPSALPKEIIVFESGDFGQVLSLSPQYVEMMVFTKGELQVGTRVTRTNTFLEVPVGPELLGQSIDPLGYPLDQTKRYKRPTQSREVDINPPGISTRKRINKPLQTGYTLVDMLIPLGRGQRELVLGDRKTGKTNFLLSSIQSQAREGNICIYAAVGKKKFEVRKVEEYFQKHQVSQNVIVVSSASDDPAGLIYLTPFTAITIAEYFRDLGRDVFVVLDDLYTHAKYYREICLLGKRFPGRNSYPADMFYVHAKLMERVGNFLLSDGREVSITCMPTAETLQGDLSGYIQTNLMSMTDGHIYFDKDLFTRGRRPAINTFLSVSRVGRQTQTDVRREINRELMSFFSLYEKMEKYVHFGAESNQAIKNTLITGDKILAYFDKLSYYIVPIELQIVLFCMLWIGSWQAVNSATMKKNLEKIVIAHPQNETMTKKVKELAQTAKSFNGLLNTIRSQQKELMTLFDIHPERGDVVKSI